MSDKILNLAKWIAAVVLVIGAALMIGAARLAPGEAWLSDAGFGIAVLGALSYFVLRLYERRLWAKRR